MQRARIDAFGVQAEGLNVVKNIKKRYIYDSCLGNKYAG